MALKVAVLMGGRSAERVVSIETGKAIAAALSELGHRVVEIDPDRDLPLVLAEEKPDVAFIALHGRGGEDGTVQGLLEIMRIPYTGSGVMASAISIDKEITKDLLAHYGLPVTGDVLVRRGESREGAIAKIQKELAFPVMVKPAVEGSSIAVTEVQKPEGLKGALDLVFERDDRALVERFISGRLLTVGIIGRKPTVLPVIEIRPCRGFYDYRAKYEPGLTEYEVPANLSPEKSHEAQDISLQAFKCVRCEDISRIDIMLEQETGRLFILEVNTIPGMTATSLIPKAAKAVGMSFEEVVGVILEGARLKVDLQE